MVKILIASHGHFASGLKSAIQILTGMGGKVETIDAYIDDSDYTLAIRQFVQQAKADGGVIFTDLVGGSVNQKVLLEVANAPKIIVVSQMNLAIILATLLEARPITTEVLDELISQSQVQRITVPKTPETTASDDDFFS
ncbi:PTS fructose transporter subunit IIA [Lacticaseibacillus zhaodongensis]|uniref:PTS sugar transporter subunit IIA domain-containing protein n=1 Tax=Lacticaseibacillus zhaodongensis TaxID=2668065 RepID=UPI0012D2F5FA|nr:PTS fructose transporter subunit IIA [Lacticaseibacillus zhaodongensis]